jgi:tRNA(fMet)-specific endonuclease VapC
MIILDTDAITFLERRENTISAKLRNRLTALSADHQIVTTVVTYEEQTRGWIEMFAKAHNPATVINAYSDLLLHLNTFKQIDVVPYGPQADARFQELRKQKIRIATRDLRIASITLAHNALLLSRNLRDFEKVPQLRVEDWAKS